MKKILILFVCLLFIVGCGKKDSDYNGDNTNVNVLEETFVLDTEGSINNLYFKHDLGFQFESEPNKLMLIYGLVEEPTFKIEIEVHPNESIDNVINSYGQNSNNKKINDIEWKVINTQDKTVYISSFNNNIYTIEFTSSNVDINELTNKFMNNVYFKIEQ